MTFLLGMLGRLVPAWIAAVLVCAALTGHARGEGHAFPPLYAEEEGHAFPPLYANGSMFLAAMEASPVPPSDVELTGIVAPHHLLAVDLIADSYARASGRDVDLVVVLSPDHYYRGETPVSVAVRDFSTALGPVEVDQNLATEVLSLDAVSPSNLFSHEHGVQAHLPFISAHFPEAQILALALDVNLSRDAADELVAALHASLSRRLEGGEKVLVVQSTDFSHYLNADQALAKDQETLFLLAQGDPGAVWTMDQPQHIDSRASLYVQLRLQQDLFQATPAVTAHRNSQYYADGQGQGGQSQTTSYLVLEFAPGDVGGTDGWVRPDTKTWWFGGDFFTGRYLAGQVRDPQWREQFIANVSALTRGAPLVLNLEGVLAEACEDPGSVPEAVFTLCMEAGPTLKLLKAMNVRAVSLANNHSRDLGEEAYGEMVGILEETGIVVLEQGGVVDLDRFELAGFTDMTNTPEPMRRLLNTEDVCILDSAPPGKPRFAMIHWGEEYRPGPDARQKHLAEILRERGVGLIIGSHSHQAGIMICDPEPLPEACMMTSLGNFLFDRQGERVSGALMRVDFLGQGTFWPQAVPIPNWYEGLEQEPPG